MKKILILLIFLVNSYLIYGQEHINLIRTVAQDETNVDTLLHKLGSLQAQFPPFERGIANTLYTTKKTIDYLNRELDYQVKHKRVLLIMDLPYYNIDIISKDEKILLFLITFQDYEDIQPVYGIYDRKKIDKFIANRNVFYNSNKTFDDLIKEIVLTQDFAFHCGDASPMTQEGKRIIKLVKLKKIDILGNMLTSFSPERQAYGVAGFDMLKQRQFKKLPNKYKELIQYIKKRNSEIMTCAGCLSGMVSTIYDEKE